MKSLLKDDVLTFFLEGRIDSNNAVQVEKEIFESVAAAPGVEVEMDLKNLEYISSAGLRIFMRLLKQTNKKIQVMNVSPEVYEIFEVTGFTQMLDVKKCMREVSIEGCPEIGSGANGKVYRLTRDEIIKIFRPDVTLAEIEEEREASRKAFLLGIPCAIAFDTVRCGDTLGTVYEMLNAVTLSERIRQNPECLPEVAEAAAQLLKQLHEIQVPAGQMPDATRVLHAKMDKLAGDFTPQELAKLHALYDSIPAMNRFVHNDFHSKNVMECGGELMLIDLGAAGIGNPLIDLCHSYLVYNLMGHSVKNLSDDDMSIIGLTFGELKRFWNVFIRTYFGSEEKAEHVNKLIAPYGLLMYFVSAMTHPMLPASYRPAFADRVRVEVLSQYDKMLGSLVGLLED